MTDNILEQRKALREDIYRTTLRIFTAGTRYLNGEIDLTEYMAELDICEIRLRCADSELDRINRG